MTDGSGDLDLSDPGYENLDLSGNANSGGTITMNGGDNNVSAGEGEHTIDLGGGADAVSGTASDLDGDTFVNFDDNDSITIEGEADATIVSRSNGSAVLGIDTDGDGVADTTITLDGAIDPQKVELNGSGADGVLTLNSSTGDPNDVLENDGPVVIDLTQGDPAVSGTSVTNVFDANGAPVAYSETGTEITIDPAQFAQALDTGESLKVTIAYDVTLAAGGTESRSSTLMVGGIDGPFTWYPDLDGDGFGDSTSAGVDDYAAPTDHVLDNSDWDDADDTVYPDAPELNDGKDNDQDGDIDEDNLAPVTGDDTGSTAPNVAFAITRTELLGNDSDPEGEALTFDGVSGAVNGTVSYDSVLGTITFVPDADYEGPASFDYTVSDPQGVSTTATVQIDVAAMSGGVSQALDLSNAAMSGYANQDEPGNSTVNLDETSQTVSMAGNTWKKVALSSAPTISAASELWVTVRSDALPEILGIGLDTTNRYNDSGDSPQAIFVLGGTKNWLPQSTKVVDLYATTGETVTFKISLADHAGVDFDHLVLIHDDDVSSAASSSVFSDIRIVDPLPFNSAPLAGEDMKLMENDAPLVISTNSLLANDTDADGDTLSVTAVGNAKNGTVVLQNGIVTFTADSGYSGDASFEYTITDTVGGTSTSTVNVTVLNAGEGEIATPVNFNDSLITSYANQDATPGTGQVVSTDGSDITLTGNVWKKAELATGPYTVTANTVLRFEMTILNPTGEIVGIGLENDDRYQTEDDALFQLFGSQHFGTWADRQYLSEYGTVGQPTSYEISLSDWAGSSFSQLAMFNDDDNNGTSSVRFSNVELVEELPGGTNGTAAPEIFGATIQDRVIDEDARFEIELPFFDTDTDFSDLTFSFVGLPAFATEEDGVLVGTPTDDDVGVYTIAVTATDPDGNATTGVFNLEVNNTNDAPTVTGIYEDQNAIINGAFVLPLPTGLFDDVDEGDVLTFSASGLPDGAVIDPTTGTISGTPTVSGSFEVTITASDGSESAFTTFTLDVADGPPREVVLIEAEAFSAFTEVDHAVDNFFSSYAWHASGREVIRLDSNESGSVSTDLASKGVAPGLYDISIIHFDEDDGASTLDVLLDLGGGQPLQLVGTFVMDRTDLPNQGNGTQLGNKTEYTFSSVDVPAGARLVLQGQAESGEVLRIDAVRFDPVENAAPVFTSPTDQTVAENTLLAAQLETSDAEGDAVTYTITGGDDAALFEIDGATGELSFLAAPDFETPGDADADNIYDVTVAADDGNSSTEQTLAVSVTDANDAPEATAELVDMQIGLNQPVNLPPLADLFSDQDVGDVLTITASGLPAGVTVENGVFTGTPTEEGIFTITVTADDGTAAPVVETFDLSVVFDFGAVSPDEDLDGDGILNAVDTDVDGDGIDNADDPFAYDAENGMLLSAGETRTYDFDVDGTAWENGMTGFLQATANGGIYDEDTDAVSVSGGVLTVNPVSSGDTGTNNNPEDDTVVGVKNGTFTAKTVVLNPWVGDAPNPGGFDQLGLVLGLNSADMIKLVFGQTAQVIEFQKQEADVGTKFGGAGPNANVPLPTGVTLDNFAKAEITFDVVSIDATSATVTGTIAFLAENGSVIETVEVATAPIGGAMAAALADDTTAVAVGFTHVDNVTAPGFVAEMDSLEISVPDDGTQPDVVVYRINAYGETVAATDGGPAWSGDHRNRAKPVSQRDGQSR